MPLQNRVTPFGEVVATPERGTMLGNRGVLHDEHRVIVRSAQLRRWICCVLSYKGIRRTLMKPRSWTELFFLDEATALSAGHRPCFECRRKAALSFQAAWARAFGTLAKAGAMDEVLSSDRRIRGGAKKTYVEDIDALPDGVFVARGASAWLLYQRRLWRWTPAGYGDPEALPSGQVEVLTPRAITRVLSAGYVPGVHPSATPQAS